jgi:hypothetical protein
MYRAVFGAALCAQERSSTVSAAHAADDSSKHLPEVTEVTTDQNEDRDDDDDRNVVLLSEDSEEDVVDVNRRNSRIFEKMGSEEFDIMMDLSQQLVAEYDAKSEDEQEKQFLKNLPTTLAPPLGYLRLISTATWVVVMCHGGSFAGAVFVNTKPILHKAFHRYVVRKKQGGKQSSHEKGGGASNSAGGQIRKSQEIKWKVSVRDILCSWREHVDRAWVILYVAPGPDNRSILTDFSLLPASASSGSREKSPIDMRDGRVRSAPLTTHKPTFKEVRRIFETVSRCTIRVKQVPGSGPAEASAVS